MKAPTNDAKKARKARNKSYYYCLKDIVLKDVLPLLFQQGWIQCPFKHGYFGAAPRGSIWELYKFEDGEVQSLVIYLTRHWSGYDRHPNLQIEYRFAHLPDMPSTSLDAYDVTPSFDNQDSIIIQRRFRPLFLYLDRRYGFHGTRWQWLLKRRIERCRAELIEEFKDVSLLKAHWLRTKNTPVWPVSIGN